MDPTPLQAKLKETESIIFDLEKNLAILSKEKKYINKITAKSRASVALAEASITAESRASIVLAEELITAESRAQKAKRIDEQEEMAAGLVLVKSQQYHSSIGFSTHPEESEEIVRHLD
jgi:hypothetical protein